MLYSMTGFGRAEGTIDGKQVAVEIKSLNGKQMELTTRLSPILRCWELDLRSIIINSLQRGTVEVSVQIKQDGAAKPMMVNTQLAQTYYQQITQLADQLCISKENILATLLQLPEVVAPNVDNCNATEWEAIKQMVVAACEDLIKHRLQEGASIEKDLNDRIQKIAAALTTILPLEPLRIARIRTRILQSFENFKIENVDQNRLEQELIYFIEKNDFSEEKTRLMQHIDYFHSVLANDSPSKGKVLGFTLQEMGREINTLGSKANDAYIQQIVIQMKDELEKAKEQILNSL